MMIALGLILILAATVFTGLLAGISLDKAIVQLPARHHMGVIEFAAFSRANDLGNGLIVYPVLGIGAALLAWAAALVVALQGIQLPHVWQVYFSAFLALLHSITTARAAPTLMRLRQLDINEATLIKTFDHFAKWHNIRAALQLLNFIVLVWALVEYILIT